MNLFFNATAFDFMKTRSFADKPSRYADDDTERTLSIPTAKKRISPSGMKA